MATAFPRSLDRRAPLRVNSSCDFVQALMQLQRAAQLITSTLDPSPWPESAPAALKAVHGDRQMQRRRCR